MSIVRIEGGCTMIDWGSYPYQFYYEWADTAGTHREYFSATQHPAIGDTIVNGQLVPKTGYIINNDPGFQKKHLPKRTWPIESQDV
jgi:hypothetical protein